MPRIFRLKVEEGDAAFSDRELMGLNTARTSRGLIRSTRMSPRTGYACFSRVCSQDSPYFLITYEAHVGGTPQPFRGDLASRPAFGSAFEPVQQSLSVPTGRFSRRRADRMRIVRNQAMLSVAPSRFEVLVLFPRRFTERRGSATAHPGVAAVARNLPVLESLLPGFGKGRQRPASEPDVMTHPVDGKPLNERSRAAARDNQKQRPSVTIAPWLRAGPYLGNGQLDP